MNEPSNVPGGGECGSLVKGRGQKGVHCSSPPVKNAVSIYITVLPSKKSQFFGEQNVYSFNGDLNAGLIFFANLVIGWNRNG